MKRIMAVVLMTVFLFCLCSCKTKNEDPVEITYFEQDDPLVVAEKALSCLLDDQSADAFMALCPYYESSYFYITLKELAENYISETGGRGTFRNIGMYSPLDDYEADEIIEYLEADGIDGVKNLREYDFTNEFENGDFENIDIMVGRIGEKWYVFSIEYAL